VKTWQEIAGELAETMRAFSEDVCDGPCTVPKCANYHAALASYEQRLAAGDEQPQQIARPWQEQAAEWLEDWASHDCIDYVDSNAALRDAAQRLRAESAPAEAVPEIYLRMYQARNGVEWRPIQTITGSQFLAADIASVEAANIASSTGTEMLVRVTAMAKVSK
jgi:hypothetical protein